MDRSIRVKFRGDRHALGPFLGNLPPEILEVVVEKLGWFRRTFAMAGKSCREAEGRVPEAPVSLAAESVGYGWKILRQHLRQHPPEESSSKAVGLRSYLLHTAAMEEDVEALEWLIQRFDGKGLEWRDDRNLGDIAVMFGVIDCLKCLHANRYPLTSTWCVKAARHGHLDAVKWLRESGWHWDENTCVGAAHGGQLEVLQWLRQNGCPWDKGTCSWAAMGGHLEVLQWARQNGCEWDENTCAYAAKGGHLEVLKWVRQNGCPWDRRTCDAAAGEGHLEMLQWARQNGCEWDEWTCFYAAEGGHLEVLQWAHQNGCPWDEETWTEADPRCRQYLIDHGCPGAG